MYQNAQVKRYHLSEFDWLGIQFIGLNGELEVWMDKDSQKTFTRLFHESIIDAMTRVGLEPLKRIRR